MPRDATDRSLPEDLPEIPDLEEQDWDDVAAADPADGDIAELKPDGELPEEDDDNPDQESDQALPDDLDERVIARDPSKEGSRFDEV